MTDETIEPSTAAGRSRGPIGQMIEAAVNAERTAISNKVEEIIEHYEIGSDGRNTFLILADWITSRLPLASSVEAPEGTAPYTIEHVTEHGWTDEFMNRRGYWLDDVTGMWLPAITILKRMKEATGGVTSPDYVVVQKAAAVDAAAREIARSVAQECYDLGDENLEWEIDRTFGSYRDLATIILNAALAAAPPSPRSDEGEAKPYGYICTGCERIAIDPDADLAEIRDDGGISCCPERKLKPFYLAAPPSPTPSIEVGELARKLREFATNYGCDLDVDDAEKAASLLIALDAERGRMREALKKILREPHADSHDIARSALPASDEGTNNE